MKDIERRLGRLETENNQQSDPTPFGPFSPARFQSAILATWRGDLQPHEALAEGHARALQYASLQAYKADLIQDPTAWTERHNQAWHALCREHGFDPNTDDRIAATRFVDSLLARVPQQVRDDLMLDSLADCFL